MKKINIERRTLLTYFPLAFSGLVLLHSGLTSLSIAVPTSSKQTFESLSMWLCGFDSLDEKLLNAYQMDLTRSFGEEKIKRCLQSFDDYILLEGRYPLNPNNAETFMKQNQKVCQEILTLWYTGLLQNKQADPVLKAYAYVNALQWRAAGVTAKSIPDFGWHLPL
ncbi:sugar dehydrogenase complex small subunit [uncultured Shewanella sp.]|uniref:sugar dehydrogenase complex small subunit n=1 Tax=uncultured Shewanella sp. TaxID=173975 RepID=UPI0026196E80|nr:sugar dehydrogenase complex small subunit [uncultured Shewanella sp.]